jgi:hypothetical protein
VQLAFAEAPLHQDRIGAMERTGGPPAGIDQRAPRRILNDEAVSVDLGDTAAH